LVNIGAMVAAQNSAADIYQCDIALTNEVTLMDNNGAVTHATFDQSGNPSLSTTASGSLTVDALQATALALGFDLTQFSYAAVPLATQNMEIENDCSRGNGSDDDNNDSDGGLS
jgi:hypothetical protein